MKRVIGHNPIRTKSSQSKSPGTNSRPDRAAATQCHVNVAIVLLHTVITMHVDVLAFSKTTTI